MLLNKTREIETGKAYICFGKHCDDKIRSAQNFVVSNVVPKVKEECKTFLYHTVAVSVDGLRVVKRWVYPRIEHMIEAVKGRDIPKEKGAASFFIVHIQEHKEKLKFEDKTK